MLKFDRFSNNCIVIMYPTGGYGNFLFHLLTEYVDCTVKVDNNNFQFSYTGNSHKTYKYTQSFDLGSQYGNLKSFTYSYTVNDQDSYNQIQQGKKFLVLGDTGNLLDSVKFIKNYFPNATVVRTYAESFNEKLVVWANTMTKSRISASMYKDSLHTAQGIAEFCKKPVDSITDQDAVDCLAHFFKNDFGKFGKFYNAPNDMSINVPIKAFFDSQTLLQELAKIAVKINGRLINQDKLTHTIEKFINSQVNFTIVKNSGSIVRKALDQL